MYNVYSSNSSKSPVRSQAGVTTFSIFLASFLWALCILAMLMRLDKSKWDILRSQLVEHSLHCDASPSFMDDCDTVTTRSDQGLTALAPTDFWSFPQLWNHCFPPRFFRYYSTKNHNILPKNLFFGMNRIERRTYSEKISKIFGIYRTNSFDDGVGIQRSRFNHSCNANVNYIWNLESQKNEFR